MDFIDGFLKKTFFEHAGGAGKLPQSAGAFGATQVTTGGGLKGKGDRVPPLDGPVEQAAEPVAAPHLQGVESPAPGKFA